MCKLLSWLLQRFGWLQLLHRMLCWLLQPFQRGKELFQSVRGWYLCKRRDGCYSLLELLSWYFQ